MKVVAGVIGLFALGFLGLSGPMERNMVYPFDPTRVSPANAGVPQMREVLFETGGETLVLWVVKPKRGKPTILYFHGNAGNLANRAPRFAAFIERGFGVVAMAYRGSSGSGGKPSQKAISADAINLHLKLPDLIRTGPVIYYGESLGTGVAIMTASSAAISSTPPTAIVLEAPYTSIADVGRRAYPKLGVFAWAMKNKWRIKHHIKQVPHPLLILHGTRDDLIPIEMGRAVFALSPAADKTFYAVKGAGHNNVWQPDAQATLYRFLNRI